MRILGRLFLKKNGLLSIYYSNKFNSKSKLNHYQGIRTMIETVSNKKLNLGKWLSYKYNSLSNKMYQKVYVNNYF